MGIVDGLVVVRPGKAIFEEGENEKGFVGGARLVVRTVRLIRFDVRQPMLFGMSELGSC